MNAAPWDEMPSRLAARPVDPRRRLPVPYVNEGDDGGVDFAVVDGARVLDCVRHKLCGLCGQPHDGLAAFIGGPGGLNLRVFTDPPGHVSCMRSALAMCPYLAIGRHQRRGLSPATAAPGFADREKSQPVFLAVTDAYHVALLGAPPALVFLPAVWKQITRYEYHDGRLVEIGAEPLPSAAGDD